MTRLPTKQSPRLHGFRDGLDCICVNLSSSNRLTSNYIVTYALLLNKIIIHMYIISVGPIGGQEREDENQRINAKSKDRGIKIEIRRIFLKLGV